MPDLKVKVGLIGKLDMLKFKNMKKVREKAIQAAPANEISGVFPINENAKALHPDALELVIDRVVDRGGAQAKTFVLKRPDGAPLPYFRAGQYISLKLPLDGSFVTRSYSLCSSPKDALSGEYAITVRSNPGGFVADRLLAEKKPGDTLISSCPQGFFYYEDLRDAKNVVGLAGGSGITPFLSMARALADGIEDFNLTLLFGSRDEDNILFRGELDELARSCPKFKVVHVLSEEEKEGFEHGFITAELIGSAPAPLPPQADRRHQDALGLRGLSAGAPRQELYAHRAPGAAGVDDPRFGRRARPGRRRARRHQGSVPLPRGRMRLVPLPPAGGYGVHPAGQRDAPLGGRPLRLHPSLLQLPDKRSGP